ncbi:MAG: class I SAM-dependent methyltransferase [Myxococcota bacterium]|nr:class I SAM-dependent methyltransferase [Myxococcota bacterium]
MKFFNTYEEQCRAMAYDELDIGGTYLPVFRALPALLEKHVLGTRALDFGCGTGRSTRFLQGLGFSTIGVDISAEMVARARKRDETGDYRVIEDGDFSAIEKGSADLVLSAFTFDNIPTGKAKVRLLRGLAALLTPRGRLVNIVSTEEIYTNEWVTFTTSAFPKNRSARTGDIVRIITKSYSDQRPVEDIFWSHADYLSTYQEAKLAPLQIASPLARSDEGMDWLAETAVAPFRIYVLKCEAS